MTTSVKDWDREEREAFGPFEFELHVLRRHHATDPPLDLLRAARAGVLPEELQELAERFLDRNARTRTVLEGLDQADVVLGDEDRTRILRRIQRRAGEAPQQRSIWMHVWRSAAAAAALAVFVASVWLVWETRRAERVQLREGERVSAVSRQPTFVLSLEKPAIKVSAAALTWRGADRENPLLSALKPGLDAFRMNDYALADRELANVSAAFPQALEPLYYQGVSRLFLNDNRGAVQSLSAAARLADPSLAADVMWYLAIAEERAGQIEDARAHLNAVCRTASEHSGAACAAAPRLR